MAERNDRDQFFTDGLKFNIIDTMAEMPQSFSLNDITDKLAEKADPPMSDTEKTNLRHRVRACMKGVAKLNKISISYVPTENKNLLTHYTKNSTK